MTDGQHQLSEGRARLAQAIGGRQTTTSRLEELRSKVVELRSKGWAAAGEAETAREFIETVRRQAADHLVDPDVAPRPAMTVREAEDAHRDAVEKEAACGRARVRAETEIKDLEALLQWSNHHPEIDVKGGVAAVLAEEPVVNQLCAAYIVARDAFQRLWSTIKAIELAGGLPAEHEGIYRIEVGSARLGIVTYADLPCGPSPEWTSAIEALSRDASAALPQLEA